MSDPIEDTMTEACAAELLEAYDTGRQIASLADRDPAFDAETAYSIAHRVTALREARGERRVGRKIGFTNRSIWPLYDVTGPMWGPVWDTTLHDIGEGSHRLPKLPEPRLEPEIVFSLKSAPRAGMSETELAGCIDWVSHGFEVVFSPFPGWRFSDADCAAAFGLHGALYLGPRLPLTQSVVEQLPRFRVVLEGPRGKRLDGCGADVLDGPLTALGHLLNTLAADGDAPQLSAGEIVTTGTLTDAAPIMPGDHWTTRLDGIELPGAAINFI
ncbi:2-keto-4-pentenoate hydratase [Roseibium sp.]|uniref:2-keto-4-pentenoate hydratase n=1 Tax=Roseibium sp. TaxID=1936156 RepID=UPI003B5038D4